MNNTETALAEKILKEATEAHAEERYNLLNQYEQLIRSAITRGDTSCAGEIATMNMCAAPPPSFPSRFRIGERVKVTVIQDRPIYGYVRYVTFTSSKVRYGIWIREAETTIHNVDSYYVEDSDQPSHFIDMPEDNLS